MVKYYDTRKKGMKKAKNGKYYYPRKGKKTAPKKSAMVRARAPIVECKKLVSGISAYPLGQDAYAHFITPRSFLKMERGTADNEMIGSSIFSKYFKMKMKFAFPEAEYGILDKFRISVTHGWMTVPFALPENGQNAPYLPNRGEVTLSQLNQIVIDRLDPHWNRAQASLEFRDKEKRIYKVQGTRWLKVNRDSALGHPQDASVLVEGSTASEYQIGQVPDIFHTCTWKPMRKINYTKTVINTDPYEDFYFPNEAWVPFVCVYTPDLTSYPVDPATGEPISSSAIVMTVNDCHWYSDS